jgi:hypothetical protein
MVAAISSKRDAGNETAVRSQDQADYFDAQTLQKTGSRSLKKLLIESP